MIVQGVSRAPNSFECFAEPTPIFCKDSANRAQYKMKGPRLSFLLPRCSLSYSKIVQTERNTKWKTQDFHFYCRGAACLGGQAPSANSNGGDASRVGFFSSLVSRKRCCYYLVEFIFSYFLYPDARRVAPIRGSVWSMNTQNAGKIKTLHKTLILPAIIIITIIHLAKHVARILILII